MSTVTPIDVMGKHREYLQVLGEIGNIQEDTANLRWSRYHHAVYTGDLIPGCKLCLRRAWCCIHIGSRCNLDCAFCPLDQAKPGISVGHDAETRQADMEALLVQNEQNPVEGVSLSGGEPLLYPDEIEEYAGILLDLNPSMHLWVYTNGTLATKQVLRRVRSRGIREIRFNLAATNFDEAVMRNLGLARGIFEYVAVELPTYPEQRHLLLSSLEQLQAIGIDQLNMQELVISPANVHRLPDDVYSVGDVTLLYGSRLLAYEVIRLCLDRDYSFTCVECSAAVKYMLDHASPLGF